MSIPERTSDSSTPDASSEEPRVTPSQNRRAGFTLALGSLGIFVVFLDTTIVNVAFQAITRSLHSTADQLAWVLNAYSLVFAAALIPAGRLADRYGRKRLFLIGSAGFAVTSTLCGLAPNSGTLIGARVLQAAFAALVSPTSLALILPEFPPRRRPFAIGVWGAMGAVAAALGPALGALLTQYLSWRWIFLVNVPVCALIVLFGTRLLRESRNPSDSGMPDPLGAVLIALIPAALSFAVIEGPRWGWSDGRVVWAFLAAAVLLPFFLWRTRRAAQPVMDLKLFGRPQFRLVSVATLLFAGAFFGALLANIVFLQTVWHYSVLRSAFAITPGPLMVAVIASIAPRLSQKYSPRHVLSVGALVFAVALSGFALLIGSEPHWTSHWLPVQLGMGMGIGLTLPVQSSAAVQELPPGSLAVGSAINASFRQLGAVLGVSLFVALVGEPGPADALDVFHHVWWLFAALGAAAGAVLWVERKAFRPAENDRP
ncbi:MFS transporter [Streptomyces flaveolus]|uniref:MFS transporter n=1 Tax=Streptomyces flaveolus TaxID=67297 RepID=UPI0033A4E311